MATNSFRFLDLNDVRVPSCNYDVLNKPQGRHDYVQYMLNRTITMFEWHGLPDTISSRMLELYLQINGYAAFLNVDEQASVMQPATGSVPKPRKFQSGLYCFFGGIGGERDIYYRPLTFIAANPRLKQSINASIVYPGDDWSELTTPCVVMRNDTNYMGLMPMFGRYAHQLVENDISLRSAQINARAQVGISVNNDGEAETARKYLDDLEAGKLGVLGKSSFLDGISVANVGVQSANVIIQLIELQQYLKASWFNELGLNANFNMKREYISREEIGSQTDVLLPMVDDMLACRQEAAELINSIFGTNITVQKNSAWADKDQTIINSLGAGAAEGDMPLIGDVADRIQEESGVSVNRDSEGVSEGAGEGEGDDSVATERGPDSDVQEEPAEAVPGAEGAKVEVNININTEGGEVDGGGEASEESE